jgi:hypothetical protein
MKLSLYEDVDKRLIDCGEFVNLMRQPRRAQNLTAICEATV